MYKSIPVNTNISLGNLELVLDFMHNTDEYNKANESKTDDCEYIESALYKQQDDKLIKPKISRDGIIKKFSLINTESQIEHDKILFDSEIINDTDDLDFSDLDDIGEQKEEANKNIKESVLNNEDTIKMIEQSMLISGMIQEDTDMDTNDIIIDDEDFEFDDEMGENDIFDEDDTEDIFDDSLDDIDESDIFDIEDDESEDNIEFEFDMSDIEDLELEDIEEDTKVNNNKDIKTDNSTGIKENKPCNINQNNKFRDKKAEDIKSDTVDNIIETATKNKPTIKSNNIVDKNIQDLMNRNTKNINSDNKKIESKFDKYSEMTIDALYESVKIFMINNGVKNRVIEISELNEEFGVDNIKNLIKKQYLIKTKKGVTVGL